MNILREKIFDSYNPNSLAWKMRQKRFLFFKAWLAQFPRPLKILDAGGTLSFWESMGFEDTEGLEIVLLNLEAAPSHHPAFVSMAGDVTDLSQFEDEAFDIVFSNSVIEHVGDDAQQLKMAREIRRVGKAYFVQTPNLYFPIESHSCYPFYQFLPRTLQAFLLYYFDLTGGGIGRTVETWKQRLTLQPVNRLPCESWDTCLQRVDSLRLLDEGKVRRFFPDAQLYEERCLGMTKSFVAYTLPLASRLGSPASRPDQAPEPALVTAGSGS
ncbi:class I SAM-dependent methyltransferase [Vampirovibrio chlorellavorus]|uniref:class I SAM-dependent methyltransferase n=1 Tax=Vampirovibrio chlorellavorus TaxID=758823 RepID=UPI0026EB9F60|nr:class I SAM-dependent methyltransferase [Vampirovibrio chlorellavorus]